VARLVVDSLSARRTPYRAWITPNSLPRLLLVHVFSPPVAPAAADYRQGGFGTSRDLYADRMAHGNALILTAIGQAVGRMPGDVAMEQQVISGRPAAELASLAWGGDLLILGSRHRGWLRRLAPGSVARACELLNQGAAVLIADMTGTLSCDHDVADALMRA